MFAAAANANQSCNQHDQQPPPPLNLLNPYARKELHQGNSSRLSTLPLGRFTRLDMRLYQQLYTIYITEESSI